MSERGARATQPSTSSCVRPGACPQPAATRRPTTRAALGLLCATVLCGCSGKGQASGTVVLTLGTQGSGAPQSIRGVEVTITLPPGVTVPADESGVPSDGVLAASGGAATVAGHYTAATGSSPGTVTLVLVKTSGFDTGEFAKVTCNLAGGTAPNAADFGLSGFKAVDQHGAALGGLEAMSSLASR